MGKKKGFNLGKAVQKIVNDVKKVDPVKNLQNVIHQVEQKLPIDNFMQLVKTVEQKSLQITGTLAVPGVSVDQLARLVTEYLDSFVLNPLAGALVVAYVEYLERQGSSRELPVGLCKLLQHEYGIDLRSVRYAEGVDTLHGQAITIGNRIHFPRKVDVLGSKSDLRWLLHELEHCVQYDRAGGKSKFLARYVAEAAASILSSHSINVHDQIDLEREANDKADRLKDGMFAVIAPKVFQEAEYRQFNSDVAATGRRPVEHWLEYGIDEGRRSSAFFDVRHYLNVNADLQQKFGANNFRGALGHYVLFGYKENRVTHP